MTEEPTVVYADEVLQRAEDAAYRALADHPLRIKAADRRDIAQAAVAMLAELPVGILREVIIGQGSGLVQLLFRSGPYTVPIRQRLSGAEIALRAAQRSILADAEAWS